MQIVYRTLEELGINNKKILTLFNKQDKLETDLQMRDEKADKVLKISAAAGIGLETVKEALEEFLREEKRLLEGVVPYALAGQIQSVRKYGELIEEEYRENGIYVKAFVPEEIYAKLARQLEWQEGKM